MHKNATKCNKTQSKWCINKHGSLKIIDTFETYQGVNNVVTKNVEQSPHKHGADFLKSFLLGRRKVSLRSAKSGAIAAYVFQP
jgi:hypothetical protein